MTTARKLTLYALVLAAVLGLSAVAGAAVRPTGLAAAKPEKPDHESGMTEGMVPGLASAEDGLRLLSETDIVSTGVEAPYRFRVLGEDGVVTDYDVEHTKRMHLIVVRRDFAGFQHLHPEMAPDGTWTTPLTIAAPGAYRVFADFVVDGDKHTLGADLFAPGDFQPVPDEAMAPYAEAGDGYEVWLDGDPAAGEESTLSFTVRRGGEVVTDIPLYLGARGHLVALRDGDLAYLHVHADEDRLSFDAEFPTAGEYRLFLQFEHRGQVRTAAFTLPAKEAGR